MSRYLFDISSARTRNRRLALTMIGSLLFHGALVGGAALLKRAPEPPAGDIFTVPFPADSPAGMPEATPEASLSTPEADTVPTPMATAPEVPVDTPPPFADPEIVDPTPATPSPVARQPVAQSHPHTLPVPSTRTGATGPATTQRASGGSSGGRTAGVRWNVASRPMYPPTLRAMRVEGSGTVRITTDVSGRVVDAVIVQSTGNTALDANTCQHARSSWTGPASTSTNVPFTYRLQ